MRQLTQEHTDYIIKNRNSHTFASMAEKLGYHRNTLRKLIEPLIKDGLITPWKHGGSKKGTVHKFKKERVVKVKPTPVELTKDERMARLRKYANQL